MNIKSISLINFRNHEKTTMTLSSGVNILVGDNAQGKTNLLEAIYLTCIGRGWRTNKDREMIKFGATDCRVKTVVQKRFGDCDVEIQIRCNTKKVVSINGIPIQKMGEL